MFWGFEDAFGYEDNCLIGSKKVTFSKVSVDKVFVATDFELFFLKIFARPGRKKYVEVPRSSVGQVACSG